MGTPTWPQLPALIEQLLADASQFDFFQALRLVETLWDERGSLGDGLDQWLRLRPDEGLVFPAADLRHCRIDDNGCLHLSVRAMGLYGVDAPMPHYFLDQATGEDEAAACLRSFLDIFNHRLYVLLYQAGRVQQPRLEREDSAYRGSLDAIAGALPGCGECGVPGSRRATASGLRGLILALLSDVPVSVRDGLPEWVEIEREGSLGARDGLQLGGDCMLGDRILTAGGRVRVELGPLDLPRAQTLLPGEPMGDELLQAVAAYLDGQAEFDVLLRVRAEAAGGKWLGAGGLRLGSETWLGERLAHEYEIRISGEQADTPKRPMPTRLAA